MSNSLPGFNTLLYVSIDGGASYTEVLELRDLKVKRAAKMMDATSHSSAGDEEYKPGLRGWTASAEALRIFADAGQNVIAAALAAGTRLKLRDYPSGVGSGKPKREGFMYIEDMDENSPISDLIATNISIRGDGPLVDGVQP
ncbi:MAG: hypothetical protein JWO13_2283 [Acidobacteriales bacterium]|nr:hypothetical protein [Terriglobales bacterium]